jgi:hypothetical protein
MYNTKFLFTYKLHDNEDDQDTMYRHEYLYAFGLKEYDSDIIIKTLEYIYKKLKDNPHFIEIIESHPHYNSNNKNHEIILQFLFSFHTLHIFHKCLVYLLSDDNAVMFDEKCNEDFIKNKKLLIDELKTKYY